MKANIIAESGMIDASGNLRLPMDRVNAFFKANKGQRIVARFEAVAPNSTAAQLSYYYSYIIPTIAAALYEQGTRKSEIAVDKWLMQEYPGEKDERQLGLGTECTKARELNQAQMSDFLEWLKQYAAENLYVYIDDPRAI